MKRSHYFRNFIISIIVIVFIGILLKQKMNVEIKSVGKILPKSEFMLIQNSPDGFTVATNNYLEQESCARQAFTYARGDIHKLDLFPAVFTGNSITAGDTLGFLHSHNADLEIEVLRGSIAEQKALLKASLSGEKSAVIEESENELQYRLMKVKEQKMIVDRLKALKQSNLVSDQEYELAVSELEMDETRVLTARAALKVVQSGDKPEDINVLRQRIVALENQLHLLLSKRQDGFIISPISGIITIANYSDTLLKIEDQSQCGVIIPVLLGKAECVSPGSRVKVRLPDLKLSDQATITGRNPGIALNSRNQYFTVTAVLDNNILPAGCLVECRILCGRTSLLQNFVRQFRYLEIN